MDNLIIRITVMLALASMEYFQQACNATVDSNAQKAHEGKPFQTLFADMQSGKFAKDSANI